MYAKIRVVLYKSKKLANGEFPVMLRIIKDRKVKYLSTGISCPLNLWSEKEDLPQKSHPHYKELKMLLGKKKLEAEKMIYDLENEDKEVSIHELQDRLKKEKSSNPHLFPYFESVIERLASSGKIKNSEIYKDTRRNLKYFTGSREILFSDVDIAFLNRYEEFLRTRGKGGNTIYLYLRTLRALINRAIKEGVCAEKHYPFKQFSLAKYARIKTEKRAISKEEIKAIVATKPKTAIAQLAKDIFLFSYYCRGINFTDIASLTWDNVKNGRLTYTR